MCGLTSSVAATWPTVRRRGNKRLRVDTSGKTASDVVTDQSATCSTVVAEKGVDDGAGKGAVVVDEDSELAEEGGARGVIVDAALDVGNEDVAAVTGKAGFNREEAAEHGSDVAGSVVDTVGEEGSLRDSPRRRIDGETARRPSAGDGELEVVAGSGTKIVVDEPCGDDVRFSGVEVPLKNVTGRACSTRNDAVARSVVLEKSLGVGVVRVRTTNCTRVVSLSCEDTSDGEGRSVSARCERSGHQDTAEDGKNNCNKQDGFHFFPRR